MILLVDFDSILYHAVYKVVSIREMREAITKFGKTTSKQWLNEQVYNEGINRCENELLKIQNEVQGLMMNDITGVELFITTCTKSFRKELTPTYKKSRKKNDYVWLLRSHYQLNDVSFSDTLEADDLIAIRAKELGKDNCIVISIDKDLKQIGGYYWSYYKVKSKDMDGNPILDEYNNEVKEYKQKSIDFITDQEASLIFWESVLSGDSGDDIKGIEAITVEQKKQYEKEYKIKLDSRVGVATAKKILANSNNHFITVARQYIARGQKENFKLNYKLLKIG